MRLFSILDFFSHDRKYLVPFNLDLFNLERKLNNKYQLSRKLMCKQAMQVFYHTDALSCPFCTYNFFLSDKELSSIFD